MGCIFCDIVNGVLPCDRVYEDSNVLAFKDSNPKASVHILVIPKQHIDSLMSLDSSHQELMGHLCCSLPKIAKAVGLVNGFETRVNTGKIAGQEVFHLHYHILGEIE